MITFGASLLTKMNVIRYGKHIKTINELNNLRFYVTTFLYLHETAVQLSNGLILNFLLLTN